MWNLYLIFGNLCIVSLSYSFVERIDKYSSLNVDVLSNTSPPVVNTELQHGIKFFNDETLHLQCGIEGKPRPLYQWYVSTSEAEDMYSNIADMQFKNVSFGNNYDLEIDGRKSHKKFFKYIYYCSAQNPLGILHSNKVIVEKVSRPAPIEIKYNLFNVYEGEKFVVNCQTTPDLWARLFKFVRWEVRENLHVIHLDKTHGRYSVITSTKTPQLHIRNITKEDFERTKIRCIFKSIVHKGFDISPGLFTSIEKLSYNVPSYLSNLCGDGETISVNVGANLELPWCSIPTTLDVTWYKVDNPYKTEVEITENNSKYKMISRRYGNLLIINTTKEDSGKYMARTTGKSKLIKIVFTVTVYEAPTISLTPTNIITELSEPAEFHCSASYSKSRFYWLHNGQKVTSGYDDGNVEIFEKNNESGLRVKKNRISVTGVYQCIAAADNELKAFSEYKQLSASLLLSKVSPFLHRQSPRVERDTTTALIQMSKNNKIKTIECIFSANPKPSIDWYLNSEKVPIESIFSLTIDEDFNSIYNFIAKLKINLDQLNYDVDMRKYAGEYQAVATNSLGVASCSTFVLMDGSLELRLPLNQTAVGGKDYLLTCYFVAMGVPEFSWDRQTDTGSWESMPSNHRTIMKDNNHKLLLKDVIKTEDEGTYRCTAKFNKEIRIASTYLNVANPPNLQNLPSKQDISEFNYHICTVNNKADKPWYVWWTFTRSSNNTTTVIDPDYYNSVSSEFSVKYDSKTPNDNNKDVKGVPDFVYQYSNKGVNLNIKERSYDKSALGRFTCHARNHIGSAEMSIEDKFLSLEFKIVPPSTSEVVVGNDLYLNCTAKESDLNPYTKWKISSGEKYIEVNDTKESYGNRIYQYANGTLVMKNIRETDPSRMFCFIIPSKKNFEVHSKVAYIDIRIPARVQSMLKEIFVVAGKSFNLSCHVYGHTKNMEVTWFHRLSYIGQWENVYKTCIYSIENMCMHKYQLKSGKFNAIIQSINTTYNVVNLEFTHPEESIAGQYKCEAINKFNKVSDEKGTRLIIISKPGKVIFHPEQKPTTPTSIEIKWKPPLKNGNRPITGYVLKYSELLLQSDKKHTSEKIFNISNNIFSKKIDNLKPFRTYEISVAAENEVGIGEPSLITVITQESIPERPVRSLKAISTLPDEITVTWDVPEPAYQNGKILDYLICYQKIPSSLDNVNIAQLSWSKSSEDSIYNIDIKCEKVQTTSFSVNKLPQFTDFGIRVIAFNSKGQSPAAFTKVRTLEDLPQAPPTQLSCKTQQQQITLHWNPPSFHTINGVLTGYTVNYYKPNEYGDESLMSTIIVHGTDTVTLDQLEPYTSYSIQIMAMNRKGNGPPSTRIMCKTAEAKPEAPEFAKVIKVNSNCWKIVWLHTLKPHGKITAYCVIETGGYSDKLKCQPPEMNKRYNYMTRCDLIDITKLKVFAKNAYDGAMKEVLPPKDNEVGDITSLGGIINVNDGSSISLPCESDFHNTIWKRDNIKISNNDYPLLKIYPNNSLEIKSIEKYTNHIYICSNERDNIEYTINVLDPPDVLLRPPLISDVKVTENSIFVSWKSGGTTNIAAPITGFSLVWNNLYTGELKTVSLDGNSRTFYLNNVTCGSEFHLKILAKNGEGQSQFSNIKKFKTLGSAPLIPDANAILQSLESNNVLFNLNAFAPGDNCSAIYFKIEVSLTSGGPNYNGGMIFNKNISIYELENKCCYRVTGLHPMTYYKFDIIAYNPAGSTSTRHVVKTGQNSAFSSTKTVVNENPINNSWLLMIVLVIAVVLIMGILVIAVLYILRNKDQSKANHDIPGVRKSEFNQPKNVPLEDTTSMDSNGEPSPYAVYQPDTDTKPNHLWSQQISQTSSPPGYNYPDHLYNKIRYDKIHQLARPMQESQGDFIRRVNSAECLSSVGNASVSGIADLESPSNIDPNDPMFHKTYKRNSHNDDVFQNIQFQGCSTVNRSNKRLRRESENLHYTEEERVKLVNQNPGWHNVPRNPPSSIYNRSINPSMRLQYHQQISVPEPLPTCSQQYGYHQTGRNRTQSGIGSSQVTIPSGASQINNYGNYYETHSSQSGYPNAKRDNSNSIKPPIAIEPYSKYIPKNHQSNYGSQQRATVTRQDFIATNGNVPRTNRNEVSDDEIYTDKVVLV